VLTDFFVVLDRFVTALVQERRAEARSESATPAVEVRRAEDWAERFDEFSADLDLFLSILTGIGVTIAVLSIVNTMLMSVTERIVEFGILKANGWSKFDVMKLIGFESAVLGVAGGILGATLGWAGTLIINARWPEHVQLYASGGLLMFAVGFSTLLGLLGGLYPAIWATRMMPMDAIRRG
jgi:putative ABC transport system permease protein